MSLFKRLFGGGSGGTISAAEPEDHNGFRIFPAPVKEGGQYRLGARIVKEVDGTEKTHHLIRADTFADPDHASEAAIVKAKQLIDQMGERLFD